LFCDPRLRTAHAVVAITTQPKMTFLPNTTTASPFNTPSPALSVSFPGCPLHFLFVSLPSLCSLDVLPSCLRPPPQSFPLSLSFFLSLSLPSPPKPLNGTHPALQFLPRCRLQQLAAATGTTVAPPWFQSERSKHPPKTQSRVGLSCCARAVPLATQPCYAAWLLRQWPG